MIAGGGTGGHVYPGVAVARTWLDDSEENQVLFVGPKRGLLSKILERERLPLKSIKASGFVGVKIGKKILSIFQLIRAFFESLEIIKDFDPHVVLGVGGYASVSPILAAWLKRKPIVLIEQNSVPGIANRILSPFASKIALGLPLQKDFFSKSKTVNTGLPLRTEFDSRGERERSFWNGPLKILVFGGSQGATAINDVVVRTLPLLHAFCGQLQFVHQTGEGDVDWVRSAYEKEQLDGDVRSFLFDIVDKYRWAHFVIARSGAVTVAEITAMALPALLIPFPGATHSHQEANAKFLSNEGAAIALKQEELEPQVLFSIISKLILDRNILYEMSSKTQDLFITCSRISVAQICRDSTSVRNSQGI
ncbi:MAG: undecaprenyldiphospho-muramoylpentapeptide beta-N-acetylglucosaminyltransferase [Nitrospinota bacterium]|nr:undecaprenyldiphospho-muramoylpentapeptide beta-N-acetylglucosaminyltransferase [Nitrospinota bacterium]